MFGNLRKDDTHQFKSSRVLSVLFRIVAVRPLRYFHRRRVRGTLMYMAEIVCMLATVVGGGVCSSRKPYSCRIFHVVNLASNGHLRSMPYNF